MKHLKQFESFENTKPEYYHEVDYTQYRKDFNYLQEFTENEWLRILKVAEDLKYSKGLGEVELINLHTSFTKKRTSTGLDDFTNSVPAIRLLSEMISHNIFKLEDDWFLVESYSTSAYSYSNKTCIYFKCDQLDGLLEFIKDSCKN